MKPPKELFDDLADMPRELERALALVPHDRLGFRPASWDGCPSEHFSALEQVCHLRDIEQDGYHVRIRRMLDEQDPDLVSIDSYALADERRYAAAKMDAALNAFRAARAATLQMLLAVTDTQWERTGTFAEYGRLTLRALVHYLRSHDQQHLAGVQWLAGRIASTGARQ
jgi:hypothetical protein